MMKKMIAFALAIIMIISLAAVAFAAETDKALYNETITLNDEITVNVTEVVAPGEAIEFSASDWVAKGDDTYPKGSLYGWQITDVDFTTGVLCGASWIDDVSITKEKDAIRLEVKESYTLAADEDKLVEGEITFEDADDVEYVLHVSFAINNTIAEISGNKKASDPYELDSDEYGHNIVTVMDEDGGYVAFGCEELYGVVKMNKDEATQLSVSNDLDDDVLDEIEEYLGEDFVDDAIIEYYQFETRAFKNEVSFSYEAYAEDPHYFYLWDGETMTELDAVYDDDEDVEAYVWTSIAEGVIVISDEEVVAADEVSGESDSENGETKNPDTGANDVVGVAAALAVVSLVAAGAIALKKN